MEKMVTRLQLTLAREIEVRALKRKQELLQKQRKRLRKNLQ